MMQKFDKDCIVVYLNGQLYMFDLYKPYKTSQNFGVDGKTIVSMEQIGVTQEYDHWLLKIKKEG